MTETVEALIASINQLAFVVCSIGIGVILAIVGLTFAVRTTTSEIRAALRSDSPTRS
jgi:hypothetical protein